MFAEEFVPPSDRSAIKDELRRVFSEGRTSTEASLLSKDGSTTAYFLSGARFTLDGIPCLVGVGPGVEREAFFPLALAYAGAIGGGRGQVAAVRANVNASQEHILI